MLFEAGQDTVALAAGEQGFAVTIPRLVWALRQTDESFPVLKGECLRIGLDEIESGTVESLLVRCGKPTTLRLELRGDRSLQEIGPVQTKSPVGSWSFALAEFRTTIVASQSPRLELILHVEDYSETLAVIEAQFFVSDLDVSTELDSSRNECIVSAEWTENRQFTGRQLRLWSRHRPWQPPVCIAVEDSAVSQCIEIVKLLPGPYLAEVVLVDEWSAPLRPAPNQKNVCDLLVGSEIQRQARLNSLRAEVPLEALELVVAGTARQRQLNVSAASSATDELADAVEFVAQLCESDSNAMSILVDLANLMLSSGELLTRLAPFFTEMLAWTRRRLEFAIVSLTQRSSSDFTDTDLERLWKTLPITAAVLDDSFASNGRGDRTAASCDRWQRFSGWRPETNAAPVNCRIEPITSPLDEFEPERLLELKQTLPPAGSLPLQWGGYQEAAFEMLSNTWDQTTQESGINRSADRLLIQQWRSSHHATYSYTQKFSTEQLTQLGLIKPKPNKPAWHKFPSDVLAASFHLVDGSSARADRIDAAAALLDAAEIAPLLTTRSILLALGLHHVEQAQRIAEDV